MPKPNRKLASDQRRGALTLEAVLVLSILILVTLAVFQFAVVMLIEQSITHAVIVAAREAGKGADIDAAVESVDAVLGIHGLHIGSGASLVLEDPLADPPVVVRGESPCQPLNQPAVPPGYVRATLCVNLGQRPFLNALKTFCLDFSEKKFTVTAIARREFTGPAEVTSRPACNCQ
ncbi:MAG: TadE/TadG family type IV pilus assembly protein [Thermogutta sp.]